MPAGKAPIVEIESGRFDGAAAPEAWQEA